MSIDGRPQRTRLLVSFDWNGTLVDDATRAWHATRHTLSDLGLPDINQRTFQSRFRLPLASFFSDLGASGARAAEAVDCWNDHMRSRPAPLNSSALKALRGLTARHIPISVVTAASWAAFAADLESTGLEEVVTFAAAAVTDKAEVLAKLSSGYTTIIYVGDTRYDMSEAAAAGAVGVGIVGGYGDDRQALLAAGASTVIGSFDELETVVDNILGDHPSEPAAQ